MNGFEWVVQSERVSKNDWQTVSKLTDQFGHFYCLKQQHSGPTDALAKEANSLRRLDEAGVRVPPIIDESEEFLLTAWVDGGQATLQSEAFASELVKMHLHEANDFGLKEDHYIGRVEQPNGTYDSWICFFREKRILVQKQLLMRANKLSEKQIIQLNRLSDRLSDLIEEPASPRLLHGDLWSGNWVYDGEGLPYLIDPCSFYGDPAYDVAMIQLFGGFPEDGWGLYKEAIGAPSASAIDVYQLYFLLVHVMMFGEMYVPAVNRILNKYGN